MPYSRNVTRIFAKIHVYFVYDKNENAEKSERKTSTEKKNYLFINTVDVGGTRYDVTVLGAKK